MRIAINQPYFVPYAGWFRLLSSVDLFVIYDDVQLPYPGYVHRNRLTTKSGGLEWLTIPLAAMPLQTKIMDIKFGELISERWARQMNKFKVFEKEFPFATEIKSMKDWESPALFIRNTIRSVCNILGIKAEIAISSMENIRPDLRGHERVLAICRHFKATEYVNAPGGVKLYDRETFRRRGIDLKFLVPYQNKTSILERIAEERPHVLRADIDNHAVFV